LAAIPGAGFALIVGCAITTARINIVSRTLSTISGRPSLSGVEVSLGFRANFKRGLSLRRSPMNRPALLVPMPAPERTARQIDHRPLRLAAPQKEDPVILLERSMSAAFPQALVGFGLPALKRPFGKQPAS
jgi:hypothetical protein